MIMRAIQIHALAHSLMCRKDEVKLTHTPVYWPFVRDYPGEPDFTEARDSEWHQLGHMQVCTSLQTDNRAITPPLSFVQAGCPSCCPTYSVKALKAGRKDAGLKFKKK